MKPKVQAIAKRFAQYLVGAMLGRSGAEFFFGQTGVGGNADFLVRNGDRLMALHIRHATNPKQVNRIYAEWLNRTAAQATLPVDSGDAKQAADDFHDPHLVIVTGAGEHVFADEAAAAFLVPDERTTLSLLAPSGAVQKRA